MATQYQHLRPGDTFIVPGALTRYTVIDVPTTAGLPRNRVTTFVALEVMDAYGRETDGGPANAKTFRVRPWQSVGVI